MEPIEIITASFCAFGAIWVGWVLSERSRRNERRNRCVDTLIGAIDTDIAHFSTLDDTASENVMRFHFDSCLRLRPHLETIKILMPEKHGRLDEIYQNYDFEVKTKENYELIVLRKKEFPRRYLVGQLTQLKAELHKL